jgi:hypothetical protein
MKATFSVPLEMPSTPGVGWMLMALGMALWWLTPLLLIELLAPSIWGVVLPLAWFFLFPIGALLLLPREHTVVITCDVTGVAIDGQPIHGDEVVYDRAARRLHVGDATIHNVAVYHNLNVAELQQAVRASEASEAQREGGVPAQLDALRSPEVP